ncbi:MAG TPA: glycosyltransferase family 39 protein [Caulobacteraceae bacterium]|nr:glycosyltransferase family 39 protein [Caulobacteraceae bacterium]
MSAPRSRSGDGAPPAVLIAIVLAVLIGRLIVGSLINLTEDEAYYRLWSMTPALGYYDHPPMIAWWLWLGRHLVGDSPLGVRLLPTLASAATSFVVFAMAREAGASRRVAGVAGVWFNATPLVLGGGFLAVPDAPASLFFSLTLWCALKARAGRPLAWWAAAGVAAGLACLSKYSALFLAPGMLLWLGATPEGRGRLRTPGPWIALLIAVGLFSLNLTWNAEHQWETLAKQFARISPHRWAPGHLVEFLVTQFVLLNPLIAIFTAAGIVLRRRPGAIDPRPFILVGAPFAVYLLIHSLHDRVQAHWPAPLYSLAVVVALAGAERLAGRRPWRWVAVGVPIVGVAAAAAMGAVLALPGGDFGRLDPALSVRGWDPFVARLDALRAQNGAAWIGTASYGLASQLLAEPKVKAPVFQIAERDRWEGMAPSPPALSKPGVVVDLSRRLDGRRLAGCFARVRPLGDIVRGDPGEPGKHYAAFAVSGPKNDLLRAGC